MINLSKSTAVFHIGQTRISHFGITHGPFIFGYELTIWYADKRLKLSNHPTKTEIALYMRVKGIHETTTPI